MKSILFAALASTLLLGACNTIAGAGKDMQKAGEAVESAAKKK
jgi:entericidin A